MISDFFAYSSPTAVLRVSKNPLVAHGLGKSPLLLLGCIHLCTAQCLRRLGACCILHLLL